MKRNKTAAAVAEKEKQRVLDAGVEQGGSAEELFDGGNFDVDSLFDSIADTKSAGTLADAVNPLFDTSDTGVKLPKAERGLPPSPRTFAEEEETTRPHKSEPRLNAARRHITRPNLPVVKRAESSPSMLIPRPTPAQSPAASAPPARPRPPASSQDPAIREIYQKYVAAKKQVGEPVEQDQLRVDRQDHRQDDPGRHAAARLQDRGLLGRHQGQQGDPEGDPAEVAQRRLIPVAWGFRHSAVSTAWRRGSRVAGSRAEMASAPVSRAASATSGETSALLNTSTRGFSCSASSSRMRSTARMCWSRSGSATSTTWRRRSASATSSKVARNAVHEILGHVTDEADRVGQDHLARRAGTRSRRRVGIERGEQLVLDEHVAVPVRG